MRGCALVVAIAGCGRVGFGPTDVDAADAPAVDAPDADAPACTAMFCDGFEDPSLGAWTADLDPPGTTTRDTSFGFQGASLRVDAPSGADYAAQHADVFPSVAPADEWVRVYIFAPSGMTLDLEPVALGNVGDEHRIVFSIYDNYLDIHAHNMAGEFNTTIPTPAPRDRWVCYELHVSVGATGTVELYMDGALVIAEPALDTRPPDNDLSRLRVGIPSKPTPLSESIFVDEVAAHTSRIGCF